MGMFEIGDIRYSVSRSINENLGVFLDKSNIRVSPDVFDAVGALMREIFTPEINGTNGVTFNKPPKDLGNYSGGNFNVMPSTATTRHITDTLFVYCMGSDNLLNRLSDTLIAVGKHNFRNVMFVTTKWDSAVVTGSNAQRLQDMIDYNQRETEFCFLLVTPCGISMIPVV
jgi:hypothetical protein